MALASEGGKLANPRAARCKIAESCGLPLLPEGIAVATKFAHWPLISLDGAP
jgi:hypothetical protein